MALYKPTQQEQNALNKLDSNYAWCAVDSHFECNLVTRYQNLPWMRGTGATHEEAMKDAIAKGLEAGKPMSDAQRLATANATKDERIKQLEAQLAALEASKKAKKSKGKAPLVETEPEDDEPEDSDGPDEGGDVPPPAIPMAPKAPTGVVKK